jgi:UDP-N-acetylmuramoylalanine--D-glutamate ligase
MMQNEFKNKKVVVAGVGKIRRGSLNSASRFFSRTGARVIITDAKPAAELKLGLRHLKGVRAVLHLGGYRKDDFKKADIVIRAQGNREQEIFLKIAERNNALVTTDIDLFMSLIPPVPTVGITGTRGKSTTTALVGEMIKADGSSTFVGGNIGVSPLNFLKPLRRDHKNGKSCAIVLELSSWLLEGWKKEGIAPTVAVITNIFPDHLNNYSSYKSYIGAKAEIFAAQDKDGIVVLNRANAVTRKMSKLAIGKVFWFSLRPFKGRGSYVKNNAIVFNDKKEEIVARLSDIKYLAGVHNLENILAAVAAAKLMGAKNSSIVKTLRSFRGLSDRQELVRIKSGVRYVNDTTATSPDGVVAALRTFGKSQIANGKSLKKKIVLIAGGKDKELDFKQMAREIKKYVKDLILFDGTGTKKLIVELKRVGYKCDIAPVVRDMKTAVRVAADMADRGDVVLLSPGAASFGLFKNEFDRGEQFKKAVRKL